ncbi:hypothetical protein KL918_000805 [Ogataea parapolymorpha]|uniref:Uncharacterized protein n=1 Tax=Ogataea parapolymorpha (strain ATCC 26012 / BCRC 20466 / JCM 22074 / NRRL Y-7560 / DL-1) TaxID=871575 RepID=W1Q8R9_OGAPD|nr:hypothetical protein HPODL_01300 [Ogataea parapolymorpha DL-1]ESW97196.1 hypothetical protein HPODL_01300 [Ogataea parapolymorpha DL-1]KAG7869260.1 hypothetical protein KL918_000805 [Ogataea parapolymorpha]KAG7875688.1 hypothetical protein KL916_000359 [Ogataea parapolymorpha]
MDPVRRAKIQRYYDFIDSSVEILRTANEKSDSNYIKEIVRELQLVVPKYGISLSQFKKLLNVVLDTTNAKLFSNSVKSRIVKIWHCYELLDFDTFLCIISSLRLSTFSNEGMTLHQRIQTNMSKWLVSNFSNFRLSKDYLRILPYLFNMLPIGYIRSNISIIIIYLIQLSSQIDESYNVKFFLNASRIIYLTELYEKDRSMLPLVMVIHSHLQGKDNLPLFDTYRYKLEEIVENDRLPKDVFKVDHQVLDSLVDLKVQYHQFNQNTDTMSPLMEIEDFQEFYYNLQDFYQMVEYLNLRYGASAGGHRYKRKKLDELTFDLNTMDILTSRSIADCYTIPTYLLHLDSIRVPRQMGLLLYQIDDFSHYKAQPSFKVAETLGHFVQFYPKLPLYTALLQLDYQELNNWMEVILGEEGQKLNPMHEPLFNGLLQLTRVSLVLLPAMEHFLLSYLQPGDPIMSTVKYYEFIPYFGYRPWLQFVPVYEKLRPLLQNATSASRVLESISDLISNWCIVQTPHEDEEFWKTVNNLIGNVISDFTESFCGQAEQYTDCKLSLVGFLRVIYRIDYEHLKLSNLVLPPVVLYDLYFSSNPVLVDGVCRHVSFCKRYYANFLSTQQGHGAINSDLTHMMFSMLKNLHNSYVMDLCNIVWRDKAFDKNEKSTAKGFMLPYALTTKMLKQRYHHYDSSIDDKEDYDFDSIKKDFDVFYAPAYSSLITDIIHRLEDFNGIDTRLTGPLNESEFNRLISNSEQWRNTYTDYDYLRLDILHELTNMGFDGLPGLLHSSLKSLSIKLRARNEH